jgi:hypothetical protein
MTEPLFSDIEPNWEASTQDFDLSTVDPEPVVFGVPEYKIESSGRDAPDSRPPKTMRERLAALKEGKKPPASRNVKKTAKEPVPNKPGQFIEPLTDFYNFVALAAMPFDPEVTMVITGPCRAPKEDEDPSQVPSVADNCARTLDEAAQRSESLRRVLASFTTASVWGAVIAAHVPILAVVAKNHTPLGEKADPAKAMEVMLKREAQRNE